MRVRAFTLIELTVTIAIIIVLVGLLVYASTSLIRASEARRTQDLLKMMDVALDEWQTAADRTMSFGMQDQPLGGELYDVEENQPLGDTPPIPAGAATVTRRMIQLLERAQGSRSIILKTDPKRLRRVTPEPAISPPAPADGWLDVLDVWDRPIIAVLPGRTWDGNPPVSDPPADRDDDGTIRTVYETIFGSASNRCAVFVSAGPDGKFGDLHLDVAEGSLTPQQRQDIADAADNVYSCEFKGRK